MDSRHPYTDHFNRDLHRIATERVLSAAFPEQWTFSPRSKISKRRNRRRRPPNPRKHHLNPLQKRRDEMLGGHHETPLALNHSLYPARHLVAAQLLQLVLRGQKHIFHRTARLEQPALSPLPPATNPHDHNQSAGTPAGSPSSISLEHHRRDSKSRSQPRTMRCPRASNMTDRN